MERPAPSAPARVSRRRGRRFWLVVTVLLALMVLFEVGIRHVPPDGMKVAEFGYSRGSTYTFAYSYAAPKDQQTISTTYASLNTAPEIFIPIFANHDCMYPLIRPPYPTSIAFTWHGIPLETWSTVNCLVSDTAGGIPAFVLTGHYWLPPNYGVPPPAP